jgi:hypothetical protein
MPQEQNMEEEKAPIHTNDLVVKTIQ